MAIRKCSAVTGRRLLFSILVFLGLSLGGTDPLRAGPGWQLYGTDYMGDLPTRVAEEHGHFRAAGLDLTVSFAHSGAENLEKLRAGETDFALMTLTPLVLDRLNDNRAAEADSPVILASISHSIGLNHVMARHDSGITQPGDLAGRRVGVMRGTNAELLLDFFLTYHEVPRESVDIRYMSTGDVTRALRAGEIEAGVVWEPLATRLELELPGKPVRFPVNQFYTARWVLVTRREIAEQFPEVCRDLLAAYAAAIKDMDRNPAQAISIYSRHSGVPPEIVEEQWNNLIHGLSLNWSLLNGLQQQISWASRAGYGPVDHPPPLLSFVAPEPLLSLMPEAVMLPLPAIRRELVP